MLTNWRSWVLTLLFVGPVLAYVVFGTVWLWEHGWLWIAALVWIVLYVVFAYLADRWTKSDRAILPPLDWTAPKTFSSRDRAAWALVEEEAKLAETANLDQLTQFELYSQTGQRLAHLLARHYNPKANDPVESVPVVELLTALELAAEDLRGMCLEIPGGDLLTASHLKQAVNAANFLQRANEVYTYLLPVLSPVTGLARLGTQKLISEPAWRNAQRTALQWFYRAFVNRLGVHLIELYSGRLAMGADTYRRLTRRGGSTHEFGSPGSTTIVAVAGGKGTGKTLLMATLEKALGEGVPASIRSRLVEMGLDGKAAALLKTAKFVEIEGYPAGKDGSSASSKRRQKEAGVAAAEAGDLLVLIVDLSATESAPDLRVLETWREWFASNPTVDQPPLLVIATGLSRLEVDEQTGVVVGTGLGPMGEEGSASPVMASNQSISTTSVAYREAMVSAWVSAFEEKMPEPKPRVLVLDLFSDPPAKVAEEVLTSIARELPTAERIALLRDFHKSSKRSRARHVLRQAGEKGRVLWKHLRTRNSD